MIPVTDLALILLVMHIDTQSNKCVLEIGSNSMYSETAWMPNNHYY